MMEFAGSGEGEKIREKDVHASSEDALEVVNMATLSRSMASTAEKRGGEVMTKKVDTCEESSLEDRVHGQAGMIGDCRSPIPSKEMIARGDAELQAAREVDSSVERLVGPSDGDGCVYVIGTAHVSTKSVNIVKELISLLVPDCVMVELCDKRRSLLQHGKKRESLYVKAEVSSDASNDEEERRLDSAEKGLIVQNSTAGIKDFSSVIVEYMRRRARNDISVTLFEALYSWMLAHIAKELGVIPGEEFRCAVEEANKIGAEVVLGDRDVKVTLKRTMSNLTFFEKLKMMKLLFFEGFSLSASDLRLEIEKLVDSDDKDLVTEMLIEVSKEFPNLLGPLVNKYHQYTANTNIHNYNSSFLQVQELQDDRENSYPINCLLEVFF